MPQRRALLIGIDDYHPAIGSLRGCVNDVVRFREVLENRFAFPPIDIKDLRDSGATRGAILEGLAWLTQSAGAGDVLVLYYSGHGTRLPNPEDPSGKDEALVPYSPEWEVVLKGFTYPSPLFLEDNRGRFFIRDKEIKGLLDALPDGVSLTLVVDCCHSGDISKIPKLFPRYLEPPRSVQSSIDDAAYRYHEHRQRADSLDETKLSTQHAIHWFEKVFIGNRFDFVDSSGRGILLAACSEKETALERPFGDETHGIFTYYLLTVLSQNRSASMTYGDLIERVGEAMRYQSPQMPRLMCSRPNRDQVIFAPLRSL